MLRYSKGYALAQRQHLRRGLLLVEHRGPMLIEQVHMHHSQYTRMPLWMKSMRMV